MSKVPRPEVNEQEPNVNRPNKKGVSAQELRTMKNEDALKAIQKNTEKPGFLKRTANKIVTTGLVVGGVLLTGYALNKYFNGALGDKIKTAITYRDNTRKTWGGLGPGKVDSMYPYSGHEGTGGPQQKVLPKILEQGKQKIIPGDPTREL